MPPTTANKEFYSTAETNKANMSPAVQVPTPTTTNLPIRKNKFPTPLLRLELRDLSLEGTTRFLQHVHGYEDLEEQVQNVLNLLYGTPEENTEAQKGSNKRPGTRSVTVILHEFAGVAYTIGSDLDEDHKKLHISTSYIQSRQGDVRHELLGVLCHELVHCFQWSAKGTPGGLIEGIADWVRLRAGLGAKHWQQEASGKWDAGYEHTGYFLDWLEGKYGAGTVRKINACLRDGKYDEEKLFKQCCDGKPVGRLWERYKEELEKRDGMAKEDDGPANPIPTHPAKTEKEE
jgi:hypothetical protein